MKKLQEGDKKKKKKRLKKKDIMKETKEDDFQVFSQADIYFTPPRMKADRNVTALNLSSNFP